MKIECVKERLEEALAKANKIAGKNVTLPVLSGLYLSAHDGALSIRATNLDVGISLNVPVKVVEPGTVVVPAHVLYSFISSLTKDKNINISTEGELLLVKTGSTETHIKTLPSDDFPVIPELSDDGAFNLPARDLTFGLRSVMYAAATNSMKPELASVSVSYQGDSLVFAATNSFLLFS